MSIIAPSRSEGSVAEAARLCHVTPNTVRNWIASGSVSARRVGPKLLLVDFDTLPVEPPDPTEAISERVARIVELAPSLTASQRDAILTAFAGFVVRA